MLCLIMTACMPAIRSEAAAKKPTCPKNQTVYINSWGGGYVKATGYSRHIFIKNLASNAKITNVKCSNKKVHVSNMGKSLFVDVVKIKAGTKARVTFKVKQKKTYLVTDL